MWHNYLYFETPDNYLVSLDARTGKERWHVEIADFNQQYFSTMAPIVVGNHVLAGTGNDLDSPGFLQSFDPETGKLQWKFYTVPMNPGDPGLDTWPSLDAARHGGGAGLDPRRLRSGDEALHLRHRQPDARLHGRRRAKGDNLFTCSLVAVNVDTGKMAWYYQTSPHDTHDWDSAQTPVLIDGDDQRPAAQARLDRGAQRLLLHASTASRASTSSTSKYGTTTNWAKGLRTNGAPEPNPEKEATIPGSLVSPVEGGVTNWPPPAYSPDTGPLLHAGEQRLPAALPDRSRSARLDGPRRQADGRRSARAGSSLTAIDPQDRQDRLAASVPGQLAAAAAAAC